MNLYQLNGLFCNYFLCNKFPSSRCSFNTLIFFKTIYVLAGSSLSGLHFAGTFANDNNHERKSKTVRR